MTGTVETIIAVTTAVGVFLGPILAERLRAAHEARHERLTQLKSATLGALVSTLEMYYLPVLSLRRPNVGIIVETRPKDNAPIDELAEDFQESLAATTPRDDEESPGLFWYRRHEPTADAEGIKFLWSEARKRYSRLFKRWDSFLVAYGAYQEMCLKTTDSLYEEIKSAVPLRESSRTIPEVTWINARWLACYVFFRALGLESARIPLADKNPDGGLVELQYQNSTILIGPRETVSTCLAVIGNLVRATASRSEFHERNGELLALARALHQEVQRMIRA